MDQPGEIDAPRRPEEQTKVDMRGPSAALQAAAGDAAAPGTRIGRYMILDVIGSGGVGIVYAAYDADLDRKVAVKQLRRSKLVGETEAVNHRRIRLRREAQALARLSHPHVVPVYEVATYDSQIYVVMEFVEGATLRSWLDQQPRSWAEVVAVFVQAGRGLAAAHAAEIVHRDFKPENVRVGADGRVRVLDFGLAGPAHRQGEEPSTTSSPGSGGGGGGGEMPSGDESSWSDSSERSGGLASSPAVTREGQIMGTPAYMAPEQAAGGTVDARSDQFSFCVALYEAIYGVRPFRGRFDDPRRFRDLSRARSLPGNRPEDLPPELERVLLRGLNPIADRRFPSMDALLGELAGVAQGPRRLWGVPIAIMLLALLAVVAFYERRNFPGEACDDGRGLLAEVWDEGISTNLGEAARRSAQPYAADTWETAAHALDEWARTWSRARVRACEATHVQGEQSPALLERRMACLDLQLIRVESTVAGLERLEGRPDALLERLPQLSLPNVEACAGAHVLQRSNLIPSSPEDEDEAAVIRQALAEVEGLLGVGELDQAVTRGEKALARARALDFEPVTAEALLLLGLAVDRQRADAPRAETLLRDAAWMAQRSGHDGALVRAAAASAAHFGGEQAELELAAVWAGLARATFERHGADLDIEPEVRRNLGILAMTAGDYETALTEYRRALELAREIGGEQNPEYIAALRAIGDAERELGRYDDAIASLERARVLASSSLGAKHPIVPEVLDALANVEASRGAFSKALQLHRSALRINEEIFGRDHRRVAKNLNNLAIIYDETGRYLESVETLERARAVLVKQLGAAHPDVAFVDVNIGSALQNLDRDEEALQRYESALTMLDDSLGPEHMAVGVTLQNIGSVRSSLGDPAGALAAFERAQDVLERAFGDSHPTLAALEHNRAGALRELDRHDEALAADTRALTMREAIFGADHPELVEILAGLARTELALDQPGRARELAERGLAILAEGNTPTEQAEIRRVLAEALLATDPDAGRERARALGLEALDALREAEGGDEARAEIERWLVRRGLADEGQIDGAGE